MPGTVLPLCRWNRVLQADGEDDYPTGKRSGSHLQDILLTGQSGSGKTTITRLINGLIPHFLQLIAPKKWLLLLKIMG